MPSLGSVAEGMTSETLDLQNIQLNQQKMQLNQLSISEGPVKLATEQIQLQRDKISLSQEMQLLQALSGLKPGQGGDTPDGMSGIMSQVAGAELAAGKVDTAMSIMSKASAIQENASKIDYRTYRMQEARLSKFSNILSTVPDSPGGLAQALQTIMAEDPRAAQDPKFQALAKMPWRPGLVPQLRDQVLSQKDKAEIKYRQQAGDHADAAAKVDNNRVALIRAQTTLTEDRDAKLKKAGVVPVKAEELRAITDQASRDYPAADPADIRVRSRPLAEDMQKLVREQHLTLSEAATRVYQQAKKTGTFGGLRQVPTVAGGTPEKALTLPTVKKGMSEKAFTDSLQENQWYSVGGVPKLWSQGTFYTKEELGPGGEREALGMDDDEDDEEAEE